MTAMQLTLSCRQKMDNITAADLMTPNPISIRHDATVYDAVVLLTERRFNAAPVINDAGRPVGVISASDLLVHDREFADYCASRAQRQQAVAGVQRAEVGKITDATTVSDIMTPAVITVAVDTPADQVIEQMIGTKVHQVFVADSFGTLAGVISALDVVQRLHQD